MKQAIIMGASAASGNIGDALVSHPMWTSFGWEAHGYDGWNGVRYETALDYNKYDACVISIGAAHIEEPPLMTEDLETVLRANLEIPLIIANRYLAERGALPGRIIFVGSYAHNHVLSNSHPYCAAKAGINQAARALAWDLRDRPDWRVHVVNPYHVEGTPMDGKVVVLMRTTRGMTYDQVREYQRRDLGGWPACRAEDVAEVLFSLVTHSTEGPCWEVPTVIDMSGPVR